jgi:hypothetical protein
LVKCTDKRRAKLCKEFIVSTSPISADFQPKWSKLVGNASYGQKGIV